MLRMFQKSPEPEFHPGHVPSRNNPQPASAEQHDYSETVCRAIAAIQRGLEPDLTGLPANVANSLKELRVSVEERSQNEISVAVEASVQGSNSMAAVARITGDIREIDSNAQVMAAAIEQLDASISQISETADSSSEEMRHAVELVDQGMRNVQETAQATGDTADAMLATEEEARRVIDSVGQIATFISTIEGIAQQTNLLALNTSIEAARAGEVGKGFAVVASEVKTLSGQTQKATEDIRELIEGLQSAVSKLLGSVEGARESVSVTRDLTGRTEQDIGNLNGIIAATSDKMEAIAGVLGEQSGATSELSQGVSQIATGSKAAAQRANEVIQTLRDSEVSVERQFKNLEGREIRNAVLHRAKSDHFLWKKHLSQMLVGLNDLQEDQLADHHSCRLGKWYYSMTDKKITGHPAFKALEDPHARVHETGKRAASLYARADREGAITAVDEMEKASEEVVRLLDELLQV